MKIMQIIPYFCFGGAETMCENLTYALIAQDHEVTVVSLLPERTPISSRMEEAGVRMVYLDKKLGLDVSMIPKLAKVMKQFRPDVVHTHLNVLKYAVPAAKLAGIRNCVHTVHNVAQEEAEGRVVQTISRIYFRNGWVTPVALSPKVQDSLVDFYGLDRKAIPVICNGIDLSRCIPKENYAADTVRLIHVGRFNEQKNHKGLLEAFRLLLQEHPRCTLDLLGDGELRQPMETYSKELGIREKVRFLGSRSDVYSYLQEADIFLMPSKFEGMPMTIIEAMGTGLPVVASPVGGIPDMLTHGESGLLASGEPEVFAQAVELLISDEALRSRLGRQARQESSRFTAEYMAEQYCAVYHGEGGAL